MVHYYLTQIDLVLAVEGLLPEPIHGLVISKEPITLRPNSYRSRKSGQKGHVILTCFANASAYIIFTFKMMFFLFGITFAFLTLNVKHVRYWLFTYRPFGKRKKPLASCKDVPTVVCNKSIPDDKVFTNWVGRTIVEENENSPLPPFLSQINSNKSGNNYS